MSDKQERSREFTGVYKLKSFNGQVYIDETFAEQIHLIEFSAYDKLRADLEVARTALEFYAKPSVWGNGCAAIAPCDTYTCDLNVLRGGKKAREALAKLEKP